MKADSPSSGLRAAADVGGTFTDLVAVDAEGVVTRHKTLSTPPDFDSGVLAGLRACAGDSLASLASLLHASTVATNAILERRGPRTGLITTEGFRDVLEVGRLRYPRLYDLSWSRPEPLAELGVRRVEGQRPLEQVGRRRPLTGVEGEAPAGPVRRRALQEVVERGHQRISGLRLDRCGYGQMALGPGQLPEAAPGESERVVDGGGAGVELESALQRLDGSAVLTRCQRDAAGAVPGRGGAGGDAHRAREERLRLVRPSQGQVGVAQPDQGGDVVRVELAGVLEARRRFVQRNDAEYDTT